MKRRDVLTMLAAGALADAAVVRAQEAGAHYSGQIALPAPKLSGSVPLEEALVRRRSMRRFNPEPLPLETVGQLLWAGQGMTSDDGKRAAPSAGALYPLELYAVSATQLLHYLPREHRAQTRATPDLRPKLQALALDQASVGAAPLVVAIAADPERLVPRYGARASPYTMHEVGHAAQNILLQATVLGLAAVPIAAVDGEPAARALELPAAQSVVYLIPLGLPA